MPGIREEAEPSPKTEAQTEGQDNPAGPYAPDPAKPGEMTLAAPQAGSVSFPVEGGNLYFDPEKGRITGCDKNVTSAVIPGEIEGVAVTEIGDYAFYGCSSLESVTIPASVAGIFSSAFQGYDRLKTVLYAGSEEN